MTNYPAPRLVDLGNPVADHPLNRGLVAWYYALPNNSGGTRLFDLAGRYHLDKTSGVSWRGNRGYGESLFTNGDNTKYVTGATPVAGLPLTLAGWFSSNGTGNQYLVSVTAGDLSGWHLMAGRSATPTRARTTDSAGNTNEADSTATGYVDRQWAHATAVFMSNTDRRAYLNGANKGTNSSSRVATTPLYLDMLGYRLSPGTYTTMYDGLCGDIGVWNRALSDSEVAALYLEGLAGNPTRLRRYTPAVWSFPAPVPVVRRPNLLLLGVG